MVMTLYHTYGKGDYGLKTTDLTTQVPVRGKTTNLTTQVPVCGSPRLGPAQRWPARIWIPYCVTKIVNLEMFLDV